MSTPLRTPKKLSAWLNNHATQIHHYQQKAMQLLALNQRWVQQIHIPLTQHSTIANWDGKTLMLAVAHSGWASELHYEKTMLFDLLSTWPHLSQLIDIKCYVQPLEAASTTVIPTQKALVLSKANKHLLQSVANTLPHAALRNALLALAHH